MSSRTNALPQPALESQAIAPATISVVRRMYWCVRRELWEYRSIYLAPLIAAGLALAGFLISTVHLPTKMHAASASHGVQQQTFEGPYTLAMMLIMFTMFVVTLFYCLDTLHGERRDRGILFWKSLPVSDLMTVLSKASIPLVVLPLVGFAITVAAHGIMLVISTLVAVGSGQSFATLWRNLSLPQMWVMLLYHLLAIHVLWYAPIYAFLLLVSAWARRMPILWATVPLLVIAGFEKIAFNTSHFAAMLQYRVTGPEGSPAMTGNMAMLSTAPPGQLLTMPGLWIGLGIAAAFLAAAVRLRRYRDPV
ncbi:MAG: ABC transporter permease [Acidobacteria bacterium]|nr:ABC transporter permease [Acidobacteriota bacterium]